MSHTSAIAIIGAGYAGMAAAVELAQRGQPATVFETSRVLGGRARAIHSHGQTLDNGQHILIGAYHATLRLMRQVGADPDHLLLRKRLHLEFPGKLRIAAPALPAPLHLAWALLGAQGLDWRDKWAAIRFMQSLKQSGFHLMDDMTVAELLERHHQTPRLRTYLWDSLCVAALNTPAQTASARIFLNVLRDSLAARRDASDLLLPRTDLGELFPETADRWLAQHGQRVRRSTAINAIEHDASSGGYCLYDSTGALIGSYRQIILAVAPHHLSPLVERLSGLDELRHTLTGFAYQPIVTCYLAYPPEAGVHLEHPMLGHTDGLIQWLFDRGQLGGPAGLLAAVISAHGRHLDLTHDELAQGIHEEIVAISQAGRTRQTTSRPPLPPPQWHQVITEKRATWSCTPNMQRPATQTGLPGLLLAGDYVAGDYPGTIEGAVMSGIAAAAAIQGR
jgi:squalene-associated FAD-dependent desaturase